MNRNDALDYLRRRLNLADNKKFNEFNDDDITFIRNYIHFIHGKMVNPQEIINAINGYPWEMFSDRFDAMLNHVIEKFNITVNWMKVDPPLRNLFGTEVYTHKVESYD